MAPPPPPSPVYHALLIRQPRYPTMSIWGANPLNLESDTLGSEQVFLWTNVFRNVRVNHYAFHSRQYPTVSSTQYFTAEKLCLVIIMLSSLPSCVSYHHSKNRDYLHYNNISWKYKIMLLMVNEVFQSLNQPTRPTNLWLTCNVTVLFHNLLTWL